MTTGTDIKIKAGGTEFGAYLASPDNPATAGVIVIQEIFGVNHHIRAVTDRLAADGYVAIAPDIFHAQEPGVQLGYDEAGMNKGIKLMQKLNPPAALADIKACLDYLKNEKDCRKVGVTGFCMGGMLTYLTAANLPVDAAAAYYGGGIANFLDQAKNIRCPIIFHFGDKDAHIPLSQVDKIKDATKSLKDCEVYVYSADHGFHCDERGSYDATAAKQAWARTQELFRKFL